MKTEQEIKDKIKQLELQLINDVEHKLLNWILEEPKYKRTIFDLTKNELTELLNILLNFQFPIIIYNCFKNIEETTNAKLLYIETNNGEYCLCEDLTIINHYDNDFYNIAMYVDTIRNMLSMEKSDAII